MTMMEYLRQVVALGLPELACSIVDYRDQVEAHLEFYLQPVPEGSESIRALMVEALELLLEGLDLIEAALYEEVELGSGLAQTQEAFDILASLEYECEQKRLLAA